MRSLADMLEPVKSALLTVSQNVGHYKAIDGTTTHIVYTEDMERGSDYADNVKDIQVVQGAIDLYAKHEEIGMADDIQQALKDAGISWHLNAVTFEDVAHFVHYEWIFEVC